MVTVSSAKIGMYLNFSIYNIPQPYYFGIRACGKYIFLHLSVPTLITLYYMYMKHHEININKLEKRT